MRQAKTPSIFTGFAVRLFKSSLLNAIARVFGVSLLLTEQVWAQHRPQVRIRTGLTLVVNVGPGFQFSVV